MRQLSLLGVSALMVGAAALSNGAEPERTPPPAVVRTQRVKVLLPPRECMPFDWKAGQQVTLGVHVISNAGTRFVGVAAGCILEAIVPRGNCVEAYLRTTETEREAIVAAAATSELWFVAMPYRKEHDQAAVAGVPVRKFLAEHAEYRPADARDWGFGAKGPRIEPPSQQVILAFRNGNPQ